MEILPYNYNVMERLTFTGKPKLGVFFGVELEMRVPARLATDRQPTKPRKEDYADVGDFNYQLERYERQAAAWRKVQNLPLREEIGDQIKNYFGEFVVFKHDGSILGRDRNFEQGWEIVTAPASLAVQRKRWEGFFSSFAGKCEAHKSCGMHVHVSRGPL